MHSTHSVSHSRESTQVNARDETRLLARSARPRETRRDDSLDDEHQTSLQKRTFFIHFHGSSRANTSVDGVARVPSISRGETTRHPSWSGHTYLDNARDATERIDARTHDAFGAFMLHARAFVTVTSRRRLARRVVEWRIPIARRLDTNRRLGSVNR